MAPAFVQGVGGTTNTASPMTLAFLSNNTAGNLLIAVGRTNGTSGVAITDTAGNSWVVVIDNNWSGTNEFFMAYALNCKAGANSVIATKNSSSISMVISEYSGVLTANALDKSTFSSSTSWTVASSGNVTPTQNRELIISGQGNGTAPASVTAGSGYSHLINDSANVASVESQIQVTAAAIAGTFTLGTSSTGAAGIMTFFAASSPISPPYSVPDCRVAPFGPNSSRLVQGTKIYDVQTSSNSAVPGTDSRTAGAPIDSRVSAIIPQNSRTPGTFGPGE